MSDFFGSLLQNIYIIYIMCIYIYVCNYVFMRMYVYIYIYFFHNIFIKNNFSYILVHSEVCVCFEDVPGSVLHLT